MNLPNLITIGRIALALLVIPLLFVDEFDARMAAFTIFIIAAVSDLWDGYLARSRGLITNLGKLLDPIADKLLLAATFVPFYLISNGTGPDRVFPWFGEVLPLWIVLVIFGRELFITLFRSYAARRGVVIAAGQSGSTRPFPRTSSSAAPSSGSPSSPPPAITAGPIRGSGPDGRSSTAGSASFSSPSRWS